MLGNEMLFYWFEYEKMKSKEWSVPDLNRLHMKGLEVAQNGFGIVIQVQEDLTWDSYRNVNEVRKDSNRCQVCSCR